MTLRLFPSDESESERNRSPRTSADAACGSSSRRISRLLGVDVAAAAEDANHAEAETISARRKLQSIRGLVFDMGDVLFDATAWRRWLIQFLRRVGLHAEYRSLFAVWDRDYLDAVHRGERAYDEAFLAFLRDAGLTSGQSDEVVAASLHVKRRIEAETRPFPAVCETLERLRSAGIRLAVLTDSESSAEAVRARLDRLGFGLVFSEIASSIDLRCTKPDPRTYQTVVERLNLDVSETAFVGHDAEELGGARRCGLTTIAFNPDPDARGDVRLRRFDELPYWLRRGHADSQTPKAA